MSDTRDSLAGLKTLVEKQRDAFASDEEWREHRSAALAAIEREGTRLMPYLLGVVDAAIAAVEDGGWANAKAQMQGGGANGTALENALTAFIPTVTPTQGGG